MVHIKKKENFIKKETMVPQNNGKLYNHKEK